jgi:hypothetical protein
MMITGTAGKRVFTSCQQLDARLARHADVGHQHLRRLGALFEGCEMTSCWPRQNS